jgi:hypothetical protein
MVTLGNRWDGKMPIPTMTEKLVIGMDKEIILTNNSIHDNIFW